MSYARENVERWPVGIALAIATVLTLPATAGAQLDDVRVVMIANDESPDVGETFQVQIEARQTGTGVAGTLVPPAFGNLRVVGTTGQMHSQSMHQVFGSAPQIESRTVIGFMLVADHPGAYTISGATYRYGRRTATSDPLVIKVDGGGAASTTTPTPNVAGDAYEFDRQMFLRATVDRTDPYVGQQVTYTLYLYSRVEGESSLTRQPSTTDFWTHDLLPPQRQLTSEFQTIRGMNFRVVVIERKALFPERPGSLEIGSAELELDVGGMIGRMMGRSESVRRASPPIRILARPLPANASAGTVIGAASLTAELDRSSVSTGEASTLTVTIVGEGSLRDTTVNVPPIPGLRVEPATIDDRVEAPRDLVGGTRTIRIQLVPLRPGTFEVPALSIDVLDPTTGALTQSTSRPLRIVATGAPIDDPVAAGPDPDEPQVPEGADDAATFGPVSPRSEMRRRALPYHARAYYVPMLVLPIVLLAAFFTVRGVRSGLAQRAASEGSSRSRRRPLADAKRAHAKGDAAAFYASISLALGDAIERSTGARAAGMTHVELRRHLLDRDADGELVDRIVDELDGADFARFSATGASKDEMSRALERTQALLDRIGRLAKETAPS